MTEPAAHPPGPDRPPSAIAHDARPPSPHSDEDDREALELQEIQTREDDELNNYSSASASSGEEYRVTTRRTRSRSSVQSTPTGNDPWSRLCRFWTHNVTMTVPQKSNRDHFGECRLDSISRWKFKLCELSLSPRERTLDLHLLGACGPANGLLALERTFLAYIRTSVVIAMQGVLVSQLFRLQRSESDKDRLGFYQVGIPLAVTCHCVAVVVALIGAYRFWRQQSAMSLGKVYAGGWELNSVGILLFLVSEHWP